MFSEAWNIGCKGEWKETREVFRPWKIRHYSGLASEIS
jgi:hypothetical protein